MYTPQFNSFTKNQIILSSDRIILHSKEDSIFLFGTQAVSLSSKNTINLDANEKIAIWSPKIELGPKANYLGQPIILSRDFFRELTALLAALKQAGEKLQSQSGQTEKLQDLSQKVTDAGTLIVGSTDRLLNLIANPANNILVSKTTFTV
jgi:hypothetical protein